MNATYITRNSRHELLQVQKKINIIDHTRDCSTSGDARSTNRPLYSALDLPQISGAFLSFEVTRVVCSRVLYTHIQSFFPSSEWYTAKPPENNLRTNYQTYLVTGTPKKHYEPKRDSQAARQPDSQTLTRKAGTVHTSLPMQARHDRSFLQIIE